MSKETLDHGMGLLRLGSSESGGDLDAMIQARGSHNDIHLIHAYRCMVSALI